MSDLEKRKAMRDATWTPAEQYWMAEVDKAEARAEALEAKLAQAVEAIEVRIHWWAEGKHCDCGDCEALVATLAEIKGDKP